MIRKSSLIILTVSVFCLLRPFAHAQEQSGEVKAIGSGNAQASSTSLDTDEDKFKYWQSLTEQQRQAIRERAQRISPEQMQALRERLDEFKKLPSREAESIKTNYERFKQMPREKRIELEQRYQRFQRLPEERKIELRRRFIEKGFIPSRPAVRNMIRDGSQIRGGKEDVTVNVKDIIDQRRNMRQSIKSDDKEDLLKDKKVQDISDRKSQVFDLQKDKKQNRPALIKKRIENRKRIINRRRSLRR